MLVFLKNQFTLLPVTLLLFVVYVATGYGLYRNVPDTFSETLFIDTTAQAVTKGIWFQGGFFMVRSAPAKLRPLGASTAGLLGSPLGQGPLLAASALFPERTHAPYFSQFGLHYKVYALSALLLPSHLELHYHLAKAVVSLLSALTMAWLVVTIKKQFGTLPSATFLLLTLGSPPILAFANKLYWLECLLVLPLAFSFACYDWLRGRGRLVYFYLGIALILVIKSLCGYEFLSNLLLSSMVPLLYYELKAHSPAALILRRLFLTGLSGVLAFVLAQALTFLQAYALLGSVQVAAEKLMQPAYFRTIGDSLGEPISPWGDLRIFIGYLVKDGQLQIFALGGGAYLLYRALFAGPRPGHADAPALWGIVLAFSLISSLSWNMLAVGHMRYHTPVNSICLFIPFNLVVYLFVGVVASCLIAARDSVAAGERSGMRSEAKSLERPA